MNEMQAGAEGDSCVHGMIDICFDILFITGSSIIYYFLRIMLVELLKKLEYPCNVVPFCFKSPLQALIAFMLFNDSHQLFPSSLHHDASVTPKQWKHLKKKT